MGMGLHFVVLICCAALMVAAVRRLIIRGIEQVCGALGLSPKTEGQIIGYVTSLPELVVVVVSAVNGVFEAGLWNVAISNIINWVLFGIAVLLFRQHGELFEIGFIDEVVFGILSVVIPLLILTVNLEMNAVLAIALFLLFAAYKVADRLLNAQTGTIETAPARSGHILKGTLAIVLGLMAILIAGHFLGHHARLLIQSIGIQAWLIGWILGVVTSIPEMSAFIEIYRLSRKRRQLHQIHDTQAALDALVASNMSNLGIILPFGMACFVAFQ